MDLIEKLNGNVSESAKENIRRWLTEDKFSDYRDELSTMIEQEKWVDLEDAFFKIIEFGTGGRRGVTGIGSNRINRVTIGESAQALCEYARSFNPNAPQDGIVIACDTRLTSEELSKYAASVCAANGFKVYIFDGFRATPELSFAVRYLKAAAGIVISASHNPPADNGFKAYWKDGGQLVPPHDKGVLDAANNINEIKTIDFDTAVSEGAINIIGEEVDRHYYEAVLGESMGDARDLHIVYSPLHGAGQTSVLPILRNAGFSRIDTVSEQMVPDGNFPTVPGGKSNPEEQAANDMAVDLMIKNGADIAITNDPDADRIGVIVNQNGKPVYLNGNQSAVLAADFSLKQLKKSGKLTSDHFLAKTIVTTDMLTALSDGYGAKMYTNMLVGFKYIGELLSQKESTNETFVIGGEESYGLLKGTYAHDKDGAVGALLLAEYAAELKQLGKTLYDKLLELFSKYGVYQEKLASVSLPGANGFTRMQSIMSEIRNNPPKVLAGYEVSAFSDYQTLVKTDILDGDTEQIDCIKGNVIVFELGDHRRRVTVRPSGTEPKLKLYLQWYEEAISNDSVEIENQIRKLDSELSDMITALEKQITAIA